MQISRVLIKPLLALVSLTILATSSGCVQERTIPALYAAKSSSLTTEQIEDFKHHCGEKWGVPQKNINFGKTYYINYDGYVMEYSGARKIALWVCHYVPKQQLGTVSQYKRPRWKVEKNVPAAVRAQDSDYPPWGIPWNRGHMAPNADFNTKEGRDGTFILSNAVPQDHENNQGIWETFEGFVRNWISQRGEAYIITGSLLYDPSDDPQNEDFDDVKSDGLVRYKVMGSNEVAIPTHIFKIVIAPKPDTPNQWESLAVVLENRAYKNSRNNTYKDQLSKGIRSIDWIEQRTGINFLPNLPDGSPEEKAIESEIAKPQAIWPTE